MKKIDKDGLILCELQAKTFEITFSKGSSSSEIFIRRFMNSKIVTQFDNLGILQSNLQEKDVLQCVDEEYGLSEYGSVKYSKNELYWIGYIYRYYSYTYDIPSKQVYKIIKPKELRGVFLPYHSLDPSQAIERILEAKGLLISDEDEINRQYKILRKNILKNKSRV